MATRPPDHPALEAVAPIGQPGAISVASRQSFPFKSDRPRLVDASDEDTTSKADAFLSLARDRWHTIDTTESALRQAMREDLEFFSSDQWDAKIKAERVADGRPCLTINRLPGFVRQLTNEMRDARPGIEVIPVDNITDPQLAEVIQGVLQHIEANSDADVAYTRAAEAQVRMGRGYFRIVPEYASDTGFEQELRIKSIRNPATVYLDQASQELDGSDARFAFIVEDIPLSEYDERFGAETRASLTEFARVGEAWNEWKPEGKIRVAEYYCFVPKIRTIVQLKNGWVVDEDDYKRLAAAAAQRQQDQPDLPPLDLTPVRTRRVEGRQLTWALINGAQILDGNADKTAGRELPGQWIPIIPVYGEELDLDGQIDLRGLIRDSKDVQRMVNYWRSAMTETVALAPKAPFVAEEGQIEGREEEWRLSNVKNTAVLKYKARSLDGQMLPPPQRNTAEPPIQAMAMLSMQMENDMRATLGFSYDVGSQEKRVEQSGRAILARQAQGEKSNSHFSAHLAISLRHAGRILLDLLPQYYDTPRIRRILGRDGKFADVVLHAGNPEEAKQIAAAQGIAESQIHDLAAGRYDVRVKAGVSYASQRQQDQELVANALQTNPAMMPLIGDLFFQTLDSPIAERISQRLKKTLPPNLQDAPDGQPPIPPEVQAKIQQYEQLIDGLTAKVNELSDEALAKREELATKERIAQVQAQTTIAVAQSKAASDAQIVLLETKIRQIEQLIGIDMARLQAQQQAGPPPGASQAPPPPPGAAPSPLPPSGPGMAIPTGSPVAPPPPEPALTAAEQATLPQP